MKDKIPVEEFKSFLEDKFSRTGFSLEEGVLDEILDVTENYPYYVQSDFYQSVDEERAYRKRE